MTHIFTISRVFAYYVTLQDMWHTKEKTKTVVRKVKVPKILSTLQMNKNVLWITQ